MPSSTPNAYVRNVPCFCIHFLAIVAALQLVYCDISAEWRIILFIELSVKPCMFHDCINTVRSMPGTNLKL
jgi:hypothetical protein